MLVKLDDMTRRERVPSIFEEDDMSFVDSITGTSMTGSVHGSVYRSRQGSVALSEVT